MSSIPTQESASLTASSCADVAGPILSASSAFAAVSTPILPAASSLAVNLSFEDSSSAIASRRLVSRVSASVKYDWRACISEAQQSIVSLRLFFVWVVERLVRHWVTGCWGRGGCTLMWASFSLASIMWPLPKAALS